MDVPALFTYPSGKSLEVRDSFFTSDGIADGDNTGVFADVANGLRGDSRRPMVVVDAYSIGTRRFDEDVLKGMRVRGTEIWFMTHIEYTEDVFDAFNTVAEMVFAPLHNIHDRDELEDIMSVSDSFVPSVFVKDGKAITIDGGKDGLNDTLDWISSIGCCRMCVVDTDSSVSIETWEDLSDEHPALMPFVRQDAVNVDFGDFRTVIRPASP